MIGSSTALSLTTKPMRVPIVPVKMHKIASMTSLGEGCSASRHTTLWVGLTDCDHEAQADDPLRFVHASLSASDVSG